jgi:OmcA/MtrC family decaheme c-type cytochrome
MAAGCGSDGSTGPQGPIGPPGPPGPTGSYVTVPSNATPASDAAAAAWAALAPQVTVTSVSINSPPVVNFTVTDGNGVPVKGLGNKSLSSTATVPGLTNLSFSLAKLVPGTDGNPSQWVSYIVTTVPTKDKTGATIDSAPTRPTTDNTGTLDDHGNGTYTYTFARDVRKMASTVAGLSANGGNIADLGDLSWQPDLLHRLTIQLSGNSPGTGNNTPNAVEAAGHPGVPLTAPADVIYDFVPATGQTQDPANSGRDIVATEKCNECHQKLGGIPGDDAESSGAGFHGGNRNETRYCVVCHTEQRKYGRSEATLDAGTLTFTSANSYKVDGRAVGNMPNNIHKIHMGKLLAKKGYNYADVLYNKVLFPQDLRNCTKCHDGSATSTAQTAQGDNWKNAPSRRACGACHDGINFADGTGVTIRDAAKGLTSTTSFEGFAHGGKSQTDDSLCSTACHTPANIEIAHTPVTPPNEGSFLHVADGSGNTNTNAASIASNTSRLPAGAIKVTYDIKSAAVVDVGGKKRAQLVFRMLQDGQPKDLNVHDSTAPSPVTGSRELWDGFMGAPSVYFVFAVPQDNISAPADFNATVSAYLRCLWNGTAQVPDPAECTSGGTLTGPDQPGGYYTATLTGAEIPASAVMVTGGLGYSYNVRTTLPLTQINLPDYPTKASPVPVGASIATAKSTELVPGFPNTIGGLIVIAPNAQKVADGYTGRRAIVEDTKCNKCHQELGTFTEDAFHAGQRNDGSTCAWCHRPNQTSSGWSADSTSFIHAIHAGKKRDVPFTWHASSTSESFADVEYPGVLKNCEGCHIPGAYDFSAGASASALPNRLYRTVATGIFNGTAGTTIPTYSYKSGSCVAGTSAPQTAVGVFSLSPYITAGTNYGIGYSFNLGAAASNSCAPDGTVVSVPPGNKVEADPASLVTSPIATACFACHDTSLARSHMEINGGSIYAPRSTALATTETCMVCHATGRIADIKVMHAK